MTTSREIDRLIKLKILSENEIIELMSLTTTEVFLIMKESQIYKQQILINIYWNPVLLYDCKSISENLIDKLIQFVEYRYMAEKQEMEERLDNGDATKSEFSEYVRKLDEHFFPNSNVVAKNIKRIIFSNKEKFKTYKFV